MKAIRFFLLAFLLIGAVLSTTSCNKIRPDDSELIENPDQNREDSTDTDINKWEQHVSLNADTITADVGDTVVIIPTFGDGVDPERTYSWEVDSSGVIEKLSVADDYSLKVVVKKYGKAKVLIRSKDEALEARSIIRTNIPEDGIIRILAIGNSFSEDVLEHYLHSLADAAGLKVIIGNMYIGGASLELHWTNASENKALYDYRVIDADGNETNTPNQTIDEVVSSEPWDYISLQQVSYQTGLYNTYIDPLPKLYDYVKGKAIRPNVKMVFHQIWAYQQGANHSGFANYNNDQMTMYNAIVDAVWKAADLRDFDKIVPAGTAIQNGRATRLGDNFNRDGVHLNSLGQYTASCTWLEAVFGKNAIGNTFAPSELTAEQIEIAQHVAHAAVVHPKGITVLDDYKPLPGNGIQDDPVYIGFGSKNIGNYSGWNAFSSNSQGSKIDNVIDYTGANTGVSIEITESFYGINSSGASGVNLFGISIPDDVAKNSYYGNTTHDEGKLKITGLDKNQTYDFCFFGARAGVSDNRETKYTVDGQNSSFAALNTAKNTTDAACVSGIQPNASGEVIITVTAGDNNTNSAGYFYLSFIRIAKSTGGNPPAVKAPVFVGFGSENINSHAGWNGFEGSGNLGQGSKINNLVDSDNNQTGISVEITASFNGKNDTGPTGATLFGISVPDDLSKHSYFGNSKKDFGGKTVVESKLKISGLDKSKTYDLCFFGSRGGVSDNRETKYIATGTNTADAVLNTASNTSNTVCVQDIQPDSNGEVVVTITAGDNNSNSYGFYYLSIMKISEN